jgi:hypothetical protein
MFIYASHARTTTIYMRFKMLNISEYLVKEFDLVFPRQKVVSYGLAFWQFKV